MYKELYKIKEIGFKKPIITVFGYYNILGKVTKIKYYTWKHYKKYLRKNK